MATPLTPRHWRLWWHFVRHRRQPGGRTLSGHHNHNYVVALREPLASIVGAREGELAKFRTRLRTIEVVPRLWRDEAEVLRAVTPYLPVPRPLETLRGRALHSFVAGGTLGERVPRGEALPESTLRGIAALFGRMAAAPDSELPARPADWPEDGDSEGFLQRLADFAEHDVHLRNRPEFGGLFAELGIPLDAVSRFRIKAGSLRPRPFGLLHTDIHRENLLLPDGGGLCLIDWENALYGDPLHDLATPLVRMDYGPGERRRMVALWRQEMAGSGLTGRLAGLDGRLAHTDDDLGVYLDFEYAQSVYPDTMRAARALPRRPCDEDYERATARVHRALRRVRGPLGLTSVPGPRSVNRALRDWRAARPATPLRGSTPYGRPSRGDS